MASIEPAKELTRTKEPEFMFLHTKDFWFRSIWIDLHQALTIDRESSRDRAPIGLVRCICKDDYKKGQHAHVKFKLGRGMGSPIPRLKEGAWTREGPRVVGGGF